MAVFGVQEETEVVEELVQVEVGIREMQPGFSQEYKSWRFRINYLQEIEPI